MDLSYKAYFVLVILNNSIDSINQINLYRYANPKIKLL